MSQETSEWLNQNVLVGFTDKRGNAWHYRQSDQGDEQNHYPGAIPIEDVRRRLFGWHAVETPLVYAHEGVTFTDETRKVIIRSDNADVLGVFKDSYVPHQYSEWLLTQVANILDDGLSIGSAGLLKGGAVAWVSVEVPENITTPSGVVFRPNLLACTSFDGSLATTYKRVVTNVVCDNTMAAGLAEHGQQLKIKHSKYSGLRLAEARDALAIIHSVADDFAAEVAALTTTTVAPKQWQSFLDTLVPFDALASQRSQTMTENKRAELVRLWNHDERVSPWSGTAWGVLQAVNTYAQHSQIVRGACRVERNALTAVTGGFDDLDTATMGTLQRVLASV